MKNDKQQPAGGSSVAEAQRCSGHSADGTAPILTVATADSSQPLPENVGPLPAPAADTVPLSTAAAAPPPPAEPTEPPLLGADGEPPSPSVAALRRFYDQLTMVESNLALLWAKRGLNAETVAALGFRSNLKTNKNILLAMENEFPPQVLLESGLFSQGEKPGDPAKPNPQFYGMSLVERRNEAGKKVKDVDGKVIVDCVWGDTGAIIIPYFDQLGDLQHLRPHKGMMRGKTPRLYMVNPCRAWREQQLKLGAGQPEAKYAGITEGEFKAAAIWQVLGHECAVAAVPGITMAKLLFGDIEEWLEDLNVRQVFIGYDNEDKGNPALPGYQEDKWKRFDAQIWARFLAAKIAKEGYEAKVCVLPDEWRDAKGKADWDGQLARLLDDEFQRRAAAGNEIGGAALWTAARPLIVAAFTAAVKASVPVRELWQAGLFDSEEERIIKNGVEKIAYERQLPVGGEDEEIIARRLQRLVNRFKREEAIPPKARNFLSMLAKKYQELKGGYYVCRRLQQKADEVWHGYLDKAANTSDADLKRACEIALKGVPERVSDFYMKAHYVLVKLNGTRVRLVSLHSVHGAKTGLIPLPSIPFSQPSKFREWLLDNISVATWKAGERELNDLQGDNGRDVAFKEVSEVAIWGYHEESKCWFFGDVAYTEDGEELFEDKSGIIWVKVKGIIKGYKLSETDQEGQAFCQRKPMMMPGVKNTEDEVKVLFQNVSASLNETLGGSTGLLVLGATLAYGAGPEIYATHNAYPGIWLHGETSQGKSSMARWLTKLWGFRIDAGMPLPDSTKVGISIALQQYGSLPVWLEEFQPDAPKWMIEKLKNFYNRESGIKKTFDEGTRKILTNVIITGIATCTDAQVKSRYVHAQVSEKNRAVNNYQWFEDNSPLFYQLGRYILKNRKAFAALTLAKMEEWLKSKETALIGPRARIVHGASFGAFSALAEILKSHPESDLQKFRNNLMQHCADAVTAVSDQVNVNLFWRELLDALASDAFGESPIDLLGIFHLSRREDAKSPVTECQLKAGDENATYAYPSGYRIYILPGPTIDKLRKHMRLSGRELPLSKEDLRTQMMVREYWVPSSSRKGTRKKFGPGSNQPQNCWEIDVDKHELGFQTVTDEEFQKSLYRDGDVATGIFVPKEEWVDLHKGDLFILVELLLKAKAKLKEGSL